MEPLGIALVMIFVVLWILIALNRAGVDKLKSVKPVTTTAPVGTFTARVVPTVDVSLPVSKALPTKEKPSSHNAVLALRQKYGRTMVVTRTANSVKVCISTEDGTTLCSVAPTQLEAVDNLVAKTAAFERSMT